MYHNHKKNRAMRCVIGLFIFLLIIGASFWLFHCSNPASKALLFSPEAWAARPSQRIYMLGSLTEETNSFGEMNYDEIKTLLGEPESERGYIVGGYDDPYLYMQFYYDEDGRYLTYKLNTEGNKQYYWRYLPDSIQFSPEAWSSQPSQRVQMLESLSWKTNDFYEMSQSDIEKLLGVPELSENGYIVEESTDFYVLIRFYYDDEGRYLGYVIERKS